MKHVYVFPYRMGSRSASALAEALQVPQIRHTGSKFRRASFKTVINWGASELPGHTHGCRILNKPELVARAANKLRFFQDTTKTKDGPRLVPWTTSRKEAQDWSSKGYTVVVRKSLQGHSGHGIIIVEPGQDLPEAPLYTQYVKKDSEWRIHMMNGQVIFRQRKIKDPDIAEPKTWKVRSHDNGFIFQHDGLTVPPDVEHQSLLAVRASGLEFGAVDVIFVKRQNKAYVLEQNCAPGLEGTTIGVYADAFIKYLGR